MSKSNFELHTQFTADNISSLKPDEVFVFGIEQ